MRTLPSPPDDPRLSWGLPRFGAMPTVERLDEVTVRILAPNPSPMTLDGTNTYVLGARGTGEAVVVDPGPADPAHLARITALVRDLDAEVRTIVLTHHHLDHTAAAEALATQVRSRRSAARRDVAGADGALLADGDRIPLRGLDLEVVATPGHTRDHVALRCGTGALLTGDHVLGRGTSVVAHPDGDLAGYLASLRRVLGLGADALFPGHGPQLTVDPSAVLRYYLDHRAYRTAQILAVLAGGPASPRAIVEVVYADVDPALWPAAEASTRAAIAALVADGRVRHDADDRAVLVS